MKPKHKMKTVIRRKASVIADREYPVVEWLWDGTRWVDLMKETPELSLGYFE